MLLTELAQKSDMSEHDIRYAVDTAATGMFICIIIHVKPFFTLYLGFFLQESWNSFNANEQFRHLSFTMFLKM